MIGNVSSGPGNGKGARGLLNYIMQKEGAEFIGGTMAGSNPRDLSKELAPTRELKPNAANPVKHFSLSLPVGERLSSEQWDQIAHRYMEGMGYENCQWVVVRHTDTEKDHIHIAASRITIEGKLVRESFERTQSQRLCRGIERDYGLKEVQSSWEKDGPRQKTRNEMRAHARTGKEGSRSEFVRAIDNEVQGSKNLEEFRSNLEKKGIHTNVTFDRSGQPKDILYSRVDFKIRGERLGQSLTLKGLERGGMVVNRDHLKMERPPESNAWDRFGAARERVASQREAASNAFASVRQTREEIKSIRARISDLKSERLAEVRRINKAFGKGSRMAVDKSRDTYSSQKLGKKIKRTDFTKEAVQIEGIRAGFDAAKAEACEKSVAPYDARLQELEHNLSAANERLQRGLDRAGLAKSDVENSRLEMEKAKLEATGGSDIEQQKKVNELEEKNAGSAAERAEMMRGKMRIDASNQFLLNIDRQMKGLEESSKRDLVAIQTRIGENQKRLAELRDEMGRKLNATREASFTNMMKGKAILGKERHQVAKKYIAEIRTIQKEQKQLRRDIASTRINVSGDRLLLMREKYYAELRATSERYAAKGKVGSKEHQDALSRVDARYSKAFEREAASIDRTFKARQDQFKRTGNVTWFSDKGKARTERIKGAFVATKEAIKGIVTGKSWKETIRATQEKWAERSINARFASDRTRGEAVRDLWKLDLSRAQQERAAAFADLSKKVAEKPAEIQAPTKPKEAQQVIPDSKALKLPVMDKGKAESLRPVVLGAASGAKTFDEIKSRLADHGIGIAINRRGESIGIVLVKDGEKVKASDYGLSINALEKQGVDCGTLRAGERAESRHDAEAGRREDGGRPRPGEGREVEAGRAEARGPEPSRTRDGAEAPRPGTDLGAGRVEPATPARDHQRLGEGQGRVADHLEDSGRRLEGREAGGTVRDAARLEDRPRHDADRDSAATGGRTPEPGRGPEPPRTPDAGCSVDQPGSQPSRDAGRASVIPPVQEVTPSRAAAEQRCTAFIQEQTEKIKTLEGQKAELQGRMEIAKGQDGRELKPGEQRVSIQDRASMREGVAKLDAQIYQEKSKGQEASMMRAEGRAEQWSKGRDLEQKAQAIRERSKELPLAERSVKLAESRQLETAAFTAKHGPDPFHGAAKDLGAAQWKAGKLMDGVDRLAKEGHIRKDQAAHIREGFGGGWNGKQLVEAVKALEGAGVHRERPPEKAGQDMLKTAVDAVQKCCGKGFDIGKGLDKGQDLSLDR